MNLNFLKHIIILCIALLSINASSQQPVSHFPVRFSQYYSKYPLLNPAMIGIKDQTDVRFGNKQLLGNFSKISTYYLQANTNISTRNNTYNKSISTLGFFIYNDREGIYLNRSRMYVSYAWHGNLTESIKFSAGFHLGTMNYNVKGSALSGDGSDWKPDGALGICFYSAKFHAGASVLQLFNSQVQPIEEITKLSPYGNLCAGYRLNITSNLSFYPSLNTHIPFDADRVTINDFNLETLYKNRLGLVFGWHNNSYLVSTLAIRNFQLNRMNFNFCLGYGTAISNVMISTNFYELSVSVSLLQKE